MAEFLFKDLSVKLFAASVEGECLCNSCEYHCDVCTHCTDGETVPPCQPCTNDVDTVCDACTDCTDGCTDGCTGADVTDGCGEGCSNEVDTNPCFPCSEFGSRPPECFGPFSDEPVDCEVDSCMEDTDCYNTKPIVIKLDRPIERVKGELEALRAELRKRVGRTAEDDRADAPRSPATVEEVDRLREALLDAVGELDARRAELEGGQPSS